MNFFGNNNNNIQDVVVQKVEEIKVFIMVRNLFDCLQGLFLLFVSCVQLSSWIFCFELLVFVKYEFFRILLGLFRIRFKMLLELQVIRLMKLRRFWLMLWEWFRIRFWMLWELCRIRLVKCRVLLVRNCSRYSRFQ